MTPPEVNAFLRVIGTDPALQARLRASDAFAAAEFAQEMGFEVTVGDLTRYKARATSWRLSDEELAVVERWQPTSQPYWWQHIWPSAE